MGGRMTALGNLVRVGLSVQQAKANRIPDGAMPFPAPIGFRWQLETYKGLPVTYNGQPNYYLERIV